MAYIILVHDPQFPEHEWQSKGTAHSEVYNDLAWVTHEVDDLNRLAMKLCNGDLKYGIGIADATD